MVCFPVVPSASASADSVGASARQSSISQQIIFFMKHVPFLLVYIGIIPVKYHLCNN